MEDDSPVHVSCRFAPNGANEVRLLAEHEAGKEIIEATPEVGPAGMEKAFSFLLPGSVRAAKVVLWVDGVAYPVFDLSMTTVFKVQRGGSEHLFLDNDTNRSVEQFTGAILLDEGQKEVWQKYATLGADVDGRKFVFRLLVCPAKEEVFQDLYGHERAAVTPIDQVLSICAGPQLVFPLDALRRERESAYSTVDTHWSDYGSKVGAIEFLRSVGLESVIDRLPTEFYPRKIYGDLGGKVDGGQTGVFMTLSKDYRFSTPGFDNGIANHGRIWTYMNADAVVDETLVLFGDSFSVSLSAILASVFKRIVYCYTAAAWDQEILAAERPGYVLAQTNQRFVIYAPRTDASLFRQIEQKLRAASIQELETMRGYFRDDCVEPYYATRMRTLLG